MSPIRSGRRSSFVRPLAVLPLLVCAVVSAQALSPATNAGQAGMLDVAALAPGFVLDMRYAGRDNFTGHVVPGYQAPRCLLLKPAAEALARVQRTLHAHGYALPADRGQRDGGRGRPGAGGRAPGRPGLSAATGTSGCRASTCGDPAHRTA